MPLVEDHGQVGSNVVILRIIFERILKCRHRFIELLPLEVQNSEGIERRGRVLPKAGRPALRGLARVARLLSKVGVRQTQRKAEGKERRQCESPRTHMCKYGVQPSGCTVSEQAKELRTKRRNSRRRVLLLLEQLELLTRKVRLPGLLIELTQEVVGVRRSRVQFDAPPGGLDGLVHLFVFPIGLGQSIVDEADLRRALFCCLKLLESLLNLAALEQQLGQRHSRL